MSEVSEHAKVKIFVADYVAVDGAGKLNVIGGNITVLGFNAEAGVTAPFGISVNVSVGPALYGSESALELVLEDSSGQAVGVPGPTGDLQLIRIAQNVSFDEKNLTALGIPRKSLRASHQMNIMFGAGLPLPVGRRYVWRVKLDHATNDEWTEEIYVPGAPSGPVIG